MPKLGTTFMSSLGKYQDISIKCKSSPSRQATTWGLASLSPEMWLVKISSMGGFPGSPLVRPHAASTSGGSGLTTCGGTKIPHAACHSQKIKKEKRSRGKAWPQTPSLETPNSDHLGIFNLPGRDELSGSADNSVVGGLTPDGDV